MEDLFYSVCHLQNVYNIKKQFMLFSVEQNDFHIMRRAKAYRQPINIYKKYKHSNGTGVTRETMIKGSYVLKFLFLQKLE